ncbi:MAG TPA: efflux RND transporter periplasmic adaptor subunit [Polyangiaceae bacterium]|jgi:RND family efflux transporter MFP subunit
MNGRRLAFILPLLCGACQHPAAAEPELKITVRCVHPTRQSIDETLELRGHLEPPPGGDLPLASQVAGRVVEVLVHEGQRVQSGDAVASVDDLPSRDAVRQAEASLAQARAAELNANATLSRTQALVARGIAARQELDDASAKAETEKQSVLSAVAALDLARRTLGRVQVRAAFGGVVTRVWRGPGAIVDGTAGTPILQVAASTGAEFVADVTERDLTRVASGRPASVRLTEAAAPLTGSVRAVSSALDPATGLGFLRISLSDAPPSLPMGAQGRATIVTAHRDSVLLVPIEALRGAVADGAEIVLCTPKGASVTSVGVGYRDDKQFEVTSHLSAEDKVALDHVLGLETGTPLIEAP